MTIRIGYDDVAVGTELPAAQFPIRRVDLIRYCGASGDFNVIHWNERSAKAAALPDVIAHGMFTMAQAARVVTDWVGDPGAVLEYGVRFSRPVVVPDDDRGVLLDVRGVIEDKLDGRRAVIGLTATVGEDRVLQKARLVVRLA